MALTVAEKINIINLGRNNSYKRVAEIFNQQNPNRRAQLHKRTVQRIFTQFRERGTLDRKKRTISAANNDKKTQFLGHVRDLFNEDPHMSTRRAGRLLQKSHTNV